MPYNFVADGFHTKKLCSRLSSSEVRFYTILHVVDFPAKRVPSEIDIRFVLHIADITWHVCTH